MELHALPDGSEVEIRPIRAQDGERLHAFHARLSPESRYRRYLGAKPVLTDADARYLVQIDGFDHFALVATAPVGGDEGAIVAVARYIRVPEDPESAEFAIVVADACQQRGLGSLLVGRLADAASERGVRRFRATMLAENVAILRLFGRLSGDGVRQRRRGAILDLEAELPVRVGSRARGRQGPTRVGKPAKIAVCAGS